MPTRNKKKKVQRKKKQGNKRKGFSLPAGGVLGRIIPGVDSLAERFGSKILDMIPFPTSGTTMSVVPPSMLAGYDRSMRVTAPAANGTYVAGQKARIKTTKTGMRVIHREYFSDVNLPTSSFNIAIDQPINPGNRILFPWLANIAKQYECYRFNSLHFIYEPGSSSTNDGFVMAAIDFDAQDPPPSSKIQMLSYDGHRAVVPWSALCLSSPGYNLRKYPQYYVTDNNQAPPNTDVKTYFVGNLFVATQNDSDPFNGGNMFVQYDIELLTPQLNGFSGTSSFIGNYIQPASPTFPPPQVVVQGGSLNIAVDGLTENVTSTNSIFDGNEHDFYIPAPGAYYVSINLTSAGSAPAITINTTDPPPFGINPASIYVTDNAGSADESFYNAYLVQTVGPVWFKLGFNFDTTVVSADLFINITPADDETLQAITPFLTPPIFAALSMSSRARRGLPIAPPATNLARRKRTEVHELPALEALKL